MKSNPSFRSDECSEIIEGFRRENEKLNKIQREMFGPAGQKHIGELMEERDRLKSLVQRALYVGSMVADDYNEFMSDCEKALGPLNG